MALDIFSPAALDKIVADTLPTLPEGHTRAIVGGVDQSGAQVVAKFAFRDNKWQVEAAAKHDWSGDNEVGARVILSW